MTIYLPETQYDLDFLRLYQEVVAIAVFFHLVEKLDFPLETPTPRQFLCTDHRKLAIQRVSYVGQHLIQKCTRISEIIRFDGTYILIYVPHM